VSCNCIKDHSVIKKAGRGDENMGSGICVCSVVKFDCINSIVGMRRQIQYKVSKGKKKKDLRDHDELHYSGEKSTMHLY